MTGEEKLPLTHNGQQVGWVWVRKRRDDDPLREYGFPGGDYKTVRYEPLPARVGA